MQLEGDRRRYPYTQKDCAILLEKEILKKNCERQLFCPTLGIKHSSQHLKR